METTTSRLRRTFKYPTADDSSPDNLDDLDETEQEHLITDLSAKASKDDQLYRLIFTALPVLCILPLLYMLIASTSNPPGSGRSSGTGRGRLSTFLSTALSITSLSLTAWSMYSVPLVGDSNGTGGSVMKSGKRPSNIFTSSNANARPRPLSMASLGEGPISTYIPLLNTVIAALLVLISLTSVLTSKDTGAGSDGFWFLLLLPAMNLAVVTVVKGSMGEIERGLGELRGLRYEYKGA